MEEEIVTTGVLYLADILSKGVASGIGKDIWEKVKSYCTSNTEVQITKDFEDSPNSLKLQNKIEFLIEKYIEENETFKKEFITFIKEKKEIDKNINLNNSKNNVINSQISVGNSGNINIGDTNL